MRFIYQTENPKEISDKSTGTWYLMEIEKEEMNPNPVVDQKHQNLRNPAI